MKTPKLVTATDIEEKAWRVSVRYDFPRLISNILRETHSLKDFKGLPDIQMDEGVQYSGYDGVAEILNSNTFPIGLNVFELGTTEPPTKKATEDYNSRTVNPLGVKKETTHYHAVTLRRWPTKLGWVKKRKGKGGWLSIQVWDANDIEILLLFAPATHIWFSELLGHPVQGVLSANEFWERWANSGEKNITPELVLAGRKETDKRIAEWLNNPADILTLRADSEDEVTACVLAHLIKNKKKKELARTLVITDKEVLSYYAKNKKTPLVLVCNIQEQADLIEATKNGHHVIYVTAEPNASNTIEPLNRAEAERSLVAMGFSEQEALSLSVDAARSLSSLRRIIHKHPQTLLPFWAQPAHLSEALPLGFISAWSNQNRGDKFAVEKIANKSYEDFYNILNKFTSSSHSPLKYIHNSYTAEKIYYTTSEEETRNYLLPHADEMHMERFKDVFIDVFIREHPSLNHLIENYYSNTLRDSLLKTFSYLRDFGSGSQKRHAVSLAHSVLEYRNKLWHSTSSNLLRYIATTCPYEYLDAVEEEIREGTAFPNLLENNRLSNVLFGLEAIAWMEEPDMATRVVDSLCKLALLDNSLDDRYQHRPLNILGNILRSTFPQTKLSFKKRLRAVDRINKEYPGIFWGVIVRSIPLTTSEFGTNLQPNGRYEPIPRIFLAKAAESEDTRAILDLATKRSLESQEDVNALHILLKGSLSYEVKMLLIRWVQRSINTYPINTLLRKRLWELVKAEKAGLEKSQIEGESRDQAMDEITSLMEALTPDRLIEIHHSLFTSEGEADYFEEESKDEWEQACSKALSEIYATEGLEALTELITWLNEHERGTIAFIIAKNNLLSLPEEIQLIRDVRKLGGTFVSTVGFWRLDSTEGWLDKIYHSSLLSEQEFADILLLLPLSVITCKATEHLAQQELYWARLQNSVIHDTIDVNYCINKLLQFHNSRAALKVFIQPYSRAQIEPELATRLIDEIKTADIKAHRHYDWEELIESLRDSPRQQGEVMKLEKMVLEADEYFIPKSHLREMYDRPRFFVEILLNRENKTVRGYIADKWIPTAQMAPTEGWEQWVVEVESSLESKDKPSFHRVFARAIAHSLKSSEYIIPSELAEAFEEISSRHTHDSCVSHLVYPWMRWGGDESGGEQEHIVAARMKDAASKYVNYPSLHKALNAAAAMFNMHGRNTDIDAHKNAIFRNPTL